MELRQTLFWDTNPAKIVLQKNAPYVIERILDFGYDAEIRWMWNYYGKPQIKTVVENSRCLRPRTKNFWGLVLA